MRIPYKINKNTLTTYEASPESLLLAKEPDRQICAENFQWDSKHCSDLITLCIQAINKNFENEQILDELPCQDRDYLLEILNTNLPLTLVVPLIDEEIYWQQRYHRKFGDIVVSKPLEWTWKSLFMERNMQEVVEQAQPEHSDEYEMDEILLLSVPYVRRLIVTQMQAWKPPLQWDEEDIPEFYPTDHINFEPIFKKLVYIEEFSVRYGMNNVSDKFNWNMYKVSVLDCQRLAKAMTHLKYLRIVRIHNSNLADQHIRAFMLGFMKNETVEELDLSHCQIGDQGALCIAKVLSVHPKLRILNLCNNQISTLGCEGLGFALLQGECLLEKLNLSLNPLREGGAMGIFRALVRGTNLMDLAMACCEYDDEAPIRTGQMLILNKSLKVLDVSNNWFDEEGGQALIDGLTVNTTLEWLDVRETEITSNQKYEIKKLLERNRSDGENEPTESVVDSENVSRTTDSKSLRTETEQSITTDQ